MESALVVHLVSPGGATDPSRWDAPDGSVRHEFVSWREMPPTLANADVVVAHGLAALVVSQSIVDVGPGLVYRPTPTPRARKGSFKGLRAGWIAASDTRSGRAAAATLGVAENRVIVVRDEVDGSWNLLVRTLIDAPSAAEPVAPVAPPAPAPVVPPVVKRGLLRARRARSGDAAPAPEIVAEALPVEAPEPAVRAPEPAPEVVVAEALPVAAPEPEVPEPEPEPEVPEPAPEVVVGAAPPVEAREPTPEREPEPEPEPVVAAGSPPVVVAPRNAPPRVAVGSVDPSSPGHPWWKYRPLEAPRAGAGRMPGIEHVPNAAPPPPPPASPPRPVRDDDADDGPPAGGPPSGTGTPAADPDHHDRHRNPREIVQTAASSGVGPFILGAALLLVVAVGAQLGPIGEGPFVIPLAGLCFAFAASKRILRKHPGEEWVARLLLLGLVAKLLACYARYFTEQVTYGGGGDVSGYDMYGKEFATAWLHGGRPPVLTNLKQTNFIRWFTGVVYFVFGQKLLTATFVFGLLALIGSYLWFRATVDAVPMVNPKLYFCFVMFAPSVAFWPAEVGKEALMQLGLGAVALGLTFFLRQQMLAALLIALPGGWLLWVVRPHLLAMATIAGGAAYLAGRVRSRHGKPGIFTRPLGIVIMAFLVAFTVGQGAKFLGLPSLSFSSIQNELDATTASTAQGGSSFGNGGNGLNPINYPSDVATVLLRPFPWESSTPLQLLSSGEGVVLMALFVFRFKSIRLAFRRSRDTPFLMYCIVFTSLYCVAFSAIANFGLLARERSLVFPALLVLIAVDPDREDGRRQSKVLRPDEWRAAMIDAGGGEVVERVGA